MLKLLFSLALVIALLLLTVDFTKLSSVLAEIEVANLATMSVLVVGVSLLSVLRWYLLLKALKFERGFREVARAGLIGQGLNVILPGGVVGDFAKLFLVAEPPERGITKTLASVGVERLLGIGALFLVIAVLLLDPGLARHLPGPLAEFAGLSGVLMLLGIIAAVAFVIGLDRAVPTNPSMPRQYLAALADMFHVVASYRSHPWTLLKTAILSILCHVLAITAIWVVANQLHSVSIGLIALAVMVSFLMTLLPVTVGGLGTREVVFLAFLSNAGFGAEGAVALSLCWFVVSSTTAVVLAAMANFLPGDAITMDMLRNWRSGGAVATTADRSANQ